MGKAFCGYAAHDAAAGVGDPLGENSRFLGMRDGRPFLRYGPANELRTSAALPFSGWHLLAVSSDGMLLTMYVDGQSVATGALLSGSVAPHLIVAPSAKLLDLPAAHTSVATWRR